MPKEIILLIVFVGYLLGWALLAWVAERDQRKQDKRNHH